MLAPAHAPRVPLWRSFVTLLSPGILNMAKKWLPRARLWKLILSQSTTGYWDASSTTALVLEARTAEEVEVLPKTLVKRILDLARSMTETVADAEAAGDGGDGPDGRHEQDDLDELFEFREEGEDEDDETPRVRHRPKRRPPTDCPVTCSVEAIVASIPRALTKLATDVPSAVKLRRVWTTMCCIAVLERLIVSWVWGDGDLYPPEERCVLQTCACCLFRLLNSSRASSSARSWTAGASGSRRRRRSGPTWQPRWRTAS